MHVRPATRADVPACAAVLRALPDWFGIEESTARYIEDLPGLETWVAEDGDMLGFIAIKRHFPRSADVHLIAVGAEHHRRGVGRALLHAAEAGLKDSGVAMLSVKTQGPSRPCEFYARTQRFYEAMGFVPLEELHGYWPGNPCLILVKALA